MRRVPTIHRAIALLFAAASLASLTAGTARAGDDTEDVLPKEADAIDVDEKFGHAIDQGAEFTDHTGKKVHISDYFDGEHPVILTFNWYNCTTLCSTQLNQLLNSMKSLEWTAGGGEFRAVTISIDPREGYELAAGKRDSYLKELDRGDDVDWSFLVGEHDQIRRLTDDMGFHYAYDEMSDQYVHTTVVYILTPDGKIARYLFGLIYEPRDLKFGLIDASNGKIGSTFDKLLLSCFHYDASVGRYGATAMSIMRFFGVLIAFVLGSILLVFFLVDRHKARELQARRLLGDPTRPGPTVWPRHAEASS